MNDSAVPAPAGPIVVGTDGSPHARHAVLFALREAQLRGTGLRAVCAYDYAPARFTGYGWMAVPEGATTLYEQLHDVARQAVTETVHELREQLGGPHVEVEIIAEAGRPTAECAAGPVSQGRLRRRYALALRPPWTALTSLNDGLSIGRPRTLGALGIPAHGHRPHRHGSRDVTVPLAHYVTFWVGN